MSNLTLTLTGFAALIQPFQNTVAAVQWRDGQPSDVWLYDSTLREHGTDWHRDHPLWVFFDALDDLGIGYCFVEDDYHG